MSQKKVDAYKEYKKNRKEIIRKEQFKRKVEYGAIIAVLVLFVGWFGFSTYQKATAVPETEETAAAVEVNMSDYADYVGGLNAGY